MTKFMKLLFFIPGLLLLPNLVMAHGSEEEHQKELFLENVLPYSLIVTCLLAIFLISIYIFTKNKINKLNVKKKEGRNLKEILNYKVKFYKWGMILSILAFLLSGSLNLFYKTLEEETSVTFKHIHGLGYASSGVAIYVPSHDGLRVYSDGKWSIPEGEKHDYMGFSMVDDGFYSSGHPAPSSNMKNPFGVIKSTDGGKSLETLDLYGEIDFHGMAVGYQSHAIYVFNPKSNSKMSEAGLYYTTNDTESWQKGSMDGVEGDPTAIAAHPTEENIVTVGTQNGVFISKNSGDTFEKLVGDLQVTAVTFDIQGNLLVGGVRNGVVLLQLDIKNKEKKQITIPSLADDDAISYIAHNPKEIESIVFTTFKKDIYLTNDQGETWVEIANEGKGILQNQE